MEKLVRPVLFGAVAILVVVGIAACGSSSSSSGGTSEDASTTAGTEPSGTTSEPTSGAEASKSDESQQIWKESIEGSNTPPESASIKPEPGKKITVVDYGLESYSGQAFKQGVEEAGKAAGWQVDVVDGEFSSNKQLTAIRKAVAEKVDGIAVYVMDCPTVQAGVEEAKEAGIPVVYTEGYDCSELKDGGPETGYTNGKYNLLGGKSGSLEEYELLLGEVQAAGAIVENKGAAKSILMNETDSNVTLQITEGYERISEACGECTIEKTIDFVASEFGPPLQEKVEQALLQAPDANAVFGNYDDTITDAAGPAVRAAGRSESMYLTGSSGAPSMLELIRNGEADMSIGVSEVWNGWAAINRFVRLFGGNTKVPDTGIGIEIIDKDHNLPASGNDWVPNVDFKSAYEKAWGVG
jgi:ribose transport system substrate-binding protein